MPLSFLAQDQLHDGLLALLQAFDFTQTTSSKTWDFAVRYSVLCDAKMSESEIRSLLANRFAEHGVDLTPSDTERRSVRITKSFLFQDSSCFILTATGVEHARSKCRGALSQGRGDAGRTNGSGVLASPLEKPHWDHDLRKLTFEDDLIKQLGRTAPIQEMALDKFQAEGWPERIDARSFLPKGTHFKASLHDVISSLNRHHITKRIRFCSDGSGFGIHWVLLPRARSDEQRRRRKQNKSAKSRRKS